MKVAYPPPEDVARLNRRSNPYGIDGLRPVDADDLADYEREMDAAIPEIIEAIRRRNRLAHEARQRWLGT